MGQEIVYCGGCARMLRTVDFERGQAFRIEGRVLCAECAPAPAKTPSRPHSARDSGSSRHKAVRLEEPRKSRGLPWMALGGSLLAAAGIAGILFLGTSSRPPASPPQAAAPSTDSVPPGPRPKPPPEEDPREKAAARALNRAREALRDHPEDLPQVVQLFDEACRVAESTGFALQAKRERAQVLQKRDELTQAAIAKALKEGESALSREDYKAALEGLDQVRSKSTLPAVREAIDARKEELRQRRSRLGEEVRAKAVQARRAGSEQEVAQCLERAGRWGDPAFLEDLRKTLAGVPPPPSPEAGTYQKSWRAALDQAGRGDLGGALSSLKSAAGTISDPRTQSEASADLALLRGAWDARQAAVQAFGKLQKGQRISLECLDESLARRKVEGTVLRSGPGWIAVKDEERSQTSFIESEDLTSLGVAALAGDRSKEAAFLGVLEGRAPDASQVGLPEKYAVWSKERGSPRPLPRESEACRLFHEAFDPEREWPEKRRKASSSALYRKLLREYSDTAFVAGRRSAIASRAEPPLEVAFLPDDLRGHGAFRLVSPEKAPSYWHVGAAAPSSPARETYLEIAFEASSESPMRAWAYVGACCAESLLIGWQATDLTGPAPHGPSVPMEPGSPAVLAVKAWVPRLPKTHVSTKVDPVNFGWVSLTMPKAWASGPKTARLLADRTGLAVKAIVLSTLRPSAPTDQEAHEFEQIAPSTLLQGLVGWWKLDDGQGPSADSSGHAHEGSWVNGPTRSPEGPATLRGGAGSLLLSGASQYVDMATPGTLPGGRSPRSLCGWGKTRSLDGGFRWIAAFGAPAYQRAMFIGLNGTSLYGGGFADDVKLDGFWDDQWHHIALTYDGTTARLYADGVERGSMAKTWDLDPQFASIGRQVNYSSEFWNGWVDDIRIYDRMLTPAEVRQLAEGR